MKQLFLNNVIFRRSEEEFLAIEYFDSKFWHQNGKWHREDGPAIIYSGGSQEWYQDGKLHREDGPAIIWSYGVKGWYIHGTKYCDFFNQLFPMENYIKNRFPGE